MKQFKDHTVSDKNYTEVVRCVPLSTKGEIYYNNGRPHQFLIISN